MQHPADRSAPSWMPAHLLQRADPAQAKAAPPPAIGRLSPAQREEEMMQMANVMRDALMQRHACTEARATEIAELCLSTLRQAYGGQDVHVYPESKAARNAAIRAELVRGNVREVARRWGLSPRQVYGIAREGRADDPETMKRKERNGHQY